MKDLTPFLLGLDEFRTVSFCFCFCSTIDAGVGCSLALFPFLRLVVCGVVVLFLLFFVFAIVDVAGTSDVGLYVVT